MYFYMSSCKQSFRQFNTKNSVQNFPLQFRIVALHLERFTILYIPTLRFSFHIRRKN